MFKMDVGGETTAEPFADEAKFYTESRLLQREVKVILESVSNQNLIGTVLHPVSLDALGFSTQVCQDNMIVIVCSDHFIIAFQGAFCFRFCVVTIALLVFF